MQNFALLRRLATTKNLCAQARPSALVKEWLLAAEYLLSGGNHQVVLCERGIKTFELQRAIRLTSRPCIGQGTLASAGDRRPVARNGQTSLIGAVSRAAIRWRGWHHRGGPPCPERALSDRTAVARSFAVPRR